jgi:hypothetical protein
MFRFLTNLRVITKPRNYDVITRFRNDVTTLSRDPLVAGVGKYGLTEKLVQSSPPPSLYSYIYQADMCHGSFSAGRLSLILYPD